jgi:type II secretory pathway predicted ATPase ExeA
MPVDDAFQRDYLAHLGFSARPFGLTPDPAFYFESGSHADALARLKAFVSRKERLALIFGDVGTGKTVLSRHFLASLDQERFKSTLIVNPMMSETELLSEAIRELNRGKASEGYGRPQGYQPPFGNGGGADQVVLAIDEAQLLSDQVLRFLVDLVSSRSETQGTLHVVLFGQKEMVGRLLEPALKSVRQRITLTHCLQPLTADEVALYVAHRLSKAGAKESIRFTDDAADVLFAHSEGYPRIINMLCDLCLLFLSSKSGTVVDHQVVRQVLKGMAAG